MDLDFRSVLVDGTFASPAVWLAVLLSSGLLCILGATLVRFVLIPQSPLLVRRLYWLPGVPVLFVALPLTNSIAFGLLFLGSFSSAELCLMPTHHPVRDFLPFVLAVITSYLFGRRSLTKLGAA